MVLGTLLDWLGVPGQIAALVSGGLLLYHGRGVLGFLSTLGFATKVLGVAAFAAFALVVLVPGISLNIAVSTVANWAAGVWNVLTGIAGVVLHGF